MKSILFILAILITQVGFGQNQQVAAIVDEHPDKFDLVFFSKVVVLFVIAVVAIISYAKYHKHEREES